MNSEEEKLVQQSQTLVVSGGPKSPRHIFFSIVLIFFGLCVATTLVLFIFLPEREQTIGFQSFSEVKRYAAAIDEFPKMDNSNIIKPDYTTFWTKISSQSYGARRLATFLQFLHLRKAPLWSVGFFKAQLERLTALRKKMGYTGNFVHKIIPPVGTQYLVIGDLQGAFHSLVCNVGKWIDLGILDQHFKIIKPNAGIIFMGNLVDRSPLSMETLSLVMRLMEENPESVFVFRGNHEYKNYWHDYGFKQELMIRAAGVSKTAIPLGDEVNAFFDTLSSALFMGVEPHITKNFVEFAHQGRDSEEKEMYVVDEATFPEFLQNPEKKLVTFNLKDAKPSLGTSDIVIQAIIKSEKKRKTFQTMEGLRMLSPDKGASAWTYLSCPTTSYQEGVKFFYDAFGVVEVGPTIEQWTIGLYNQDVRMRQGYSFKNFYLLSGTVVTGIIAPSQAQVQDQAQVSVVAAPVQAPVAAPVQLPVPQAPILQPPAPPASQVPVPQAPVPQAVKPQAPLPPVPQQTQKIDTFVDLLRRR